VIMPDGLGVYRLRFTSKNSLRSLISTLKYVGGLTKGRLAGIPFDIYLEKREVAAPDGSRRKVPVWRFVMTPPEQIALTSQNFRVIMGQALEQGHQLMLPENLDETWERLDHDGPDIDMDAVEVLNGGGRCEKDYYNRAWHALAQGTPFENDETRHQTVHNFTDGAYNSLALFLAKATDEAAAGLIAHLAALIRDWRGLEPEPPEEEPVTPTVEPEEEPAAHGVSQEVEGLVAETLALLPSAFTSDAAVKSYIVTNYLKPANRPVEDYRKPVDELLVTFPLDDLRELIGCCNARIGKKRGPVAPEPDPPATAEPAPFQDPDQDDTADPFDGAYLDGPIPQDRAAQEDWAGKLLLAIGRGSGPERASWFSERKLPLPPNIEKLKDADLLRLINSARHELREREKGQAA